VLLTFDISIHNIFFSCGGNFSYVEAQVSVLLTLHGLFAFVIIRTFEVKSYLRLFYFFFTVLSVLSINLVAIFFINLTMLLKRCCTSINTGLCDLIAREDEESVGVYRQISHVKHTEQLIELNYNTDRLTLSDPTSNLVRQYDFSVRLRCRKTSDTVFVAFVRPLSAPV
jgi:hypothetical protein